MSAQATDTLPICLAVRFKTALYVFISFLKLWQVRGVAKSCEY